jgi:hypothetical protein
MDGQCGPRFGTCASDECCSLEGYCGTSEGGSSKPSPSPVLMERQIIAPLPTVYSTLGLPAMQTRYPLGATLRVSRDPYVQLMISIHALSPELWHLLLMTVRSSTQVIS